MNRFISVDLARLRTVSPENFFIVTSAPAHSSSRTVLRLSASTASCTGLHTPHTHLYTHWHIHLHTQQQSHSDQTVCLDCVMYRPTDTDTHTSTPQLQIVRHELINRIIAIFRYLKWFVYIRCDITLSCFDGFRWLLSFPRVVSTLIFCASSAASSLKMQ